MMMIRIYLYSLAIFLFTVQILGQNNFRIFPSTVTQTEPIVVISKTDSNLFFASSVTINTGNGFKSEGIYISTNGGLNWFGSDTCYGQSIINHGGDPGVILTLNNKLVLTHMGSVFPGVYSHYSTDYGNTWSNANTLTSQQTDDKGTSIMDDNQSSPYYGRIYSSFVKLISPYPIYFTHSDDEALNWSTPFIINPSPARRCIGPSIVIDKNGKLFVCWASITATAPFFEDYVSFASSTDGGSTWQNISNIFDVNGIYGTLPEKGGIRVNGLPRIAIDKSAGSRSGWLYIVTTDKNISPAGSDADIVLHRSTDGGLTWSEGIRINQDEKNNGKIQYFPAIDIDNNGGINIIYYDDRNTSSDSAEIFLSRSTDGGETWSDRVISDHKFKPKPVVGGSSNFQGDYITLIANGRKLYCYWMDDFSGLYQVWSKIIDIPTSVNDERPDLQPNEFTLSQNFPNPFNPNTTIEYKLPGNGNINLKIYDITGREIATLINEYKNAGSYKVNFTLDGLNLASGVYFYRLAFNGVSETRPMILLK